MFRKYAPLALLLVAVLAVLAGVVSNSRASVAQADDGPAYAYRVLDVFEMKGRDIQPVINEYGASGWEMVAADQNRVFFKKQVR